MNWLKSGRGLSTKSNVDTVDAIAFNISLAKKKKKKVKSNPLLTVSEHSIVICSKTSVYRTLINMNLKHFGHDPHRIRYTVLINFFARNFLLSFVIYDVGVRTRNNHIF